MLLSDIGLNEVHIGEALEKRRKAINMSKSDLARKIGVRQQHINKVFENETIDTGKLILASRALSFNFFTLYSSKSNNVSAFLSAVALGDGNAENMIGDAAIASQLQLQAVQINDMNENKEILKDQVQTLKDQVETLKSQVKLQESTIKEKDDIIAHYKDLVNKK